MSVVMPWWFWPLAVMWTVPVIGCVWLVVAVLVGDWRSDRAVARMERRSEERAHELLGSCPIREHTGDGGYVGRCAFATHGGYCPRHGAVEDYPTHDDREVRVQDRRRPPAERVARVRGWRGLP